MCTLHMHTIRLERVHDFDMPSYNGKAVKNTEYSSKEETKLPPTYLNVERTNWIRFAREKYL